MSIRNAIVTVVALGALLAGCGGGGSAPAAPANGTLHAAAPSQTQSVTIKINIPGRVPAGVRRTTYVGAGTQSAVISVTAGTGVQTPSPASTTVNCTTSCTATVAVYPGSNTFAVSLYDGTNGSGNLLSTGSATQTINAGSNTVNLTFNGVPFAVMALPNPPGFTSGIAGSSTLTVNAYDVDANVIVAPGIYTTSITLASNSPHVTLTPTSVTGPGQTVTASYDGTAVACSSPVLIAGTIGSVTGPAGSLLISAGAPCGIALSQPLITVTSGGGMGTVQVLSDPGVVGTITIVNDTCTGPGNATITPSSVSTGSLPATFTITGLVATAPFCTYGFTDGVNLATLQVTVM